MNVLETLKRKNVTASDMAEKFGIDKSLVTKWKQNKRKIVAAACTEHKKMLRKGRPSERHRQVYNKSYKRFCHVRKRGLKVPFSWFYVTMNKIQKEIKADGARIPKSAVTRFIRQYKIKLQRVQCKKRVEKTNFQGQMMQWHSTLREGLIKVCMHAFLVILCSISIPLQNSLFMPMFTCF